MRRKSTNTDASREQKTKRSLDPGRKLDIIGILMIVCAMLLFLAIVSYSSADQSSADLGAGDLLRLFGGDPDIQARADLTRNWLGLFGALLAGFLINATVGFFSIALPLGLAIWGWFILRKKDLRVLSYYTNYSVLFVLLLATFFGLLRLVPWMPDISPAWAGNVGDFTAGLLSRLIGTTGGIIGVIATGVIIAIIAVDYDIHRTLDRVRRLVGALLSSLRGDAMRELRREREAASRVASDIPPVPDPVPDVVLPTKKKTEPLHAKPVQPIVAESGFETPRHVPVSIARTDVAQNGYTTPSVSSEASMRSNGVISKENVEELRGLYGDDADGKHIEQQPKKTDLAQKASAASRSPEDSPKQQTANSMPVSNNASVPFESTEPLMNEHEKKAVQQAVAKKMAVAESDVNSEETNKELALEKLSGYQYPNESLLDDAQRAHVISDQELKLKADQVIEKLSVFGIGIRDIRVIPGPVVTQFELVPDSSVKISKIVSLSDDLALALAARGIRIIAPIPGKSAVGVEIPNNSPEMVNFKSVVSSSVFQKARHHLPLGLGKSITGDVFIDDLAKMPHLLIAGATGSGKSVGINVMIASLLYKSHPADVKFVMIDPKKIELQQYRGLSRHFLATCPDIDEEIITDPANAVIVLKSLEMEMDMRYTKLAKAGVRHVNDYNVKVKSGALRETETLTHYRLPYIVVIIDELADLMITAAREVEEPIARLAQLARAVGIHLIVATQRPSVDVLTGVIKANFSARIAYQVASRIDSRTILDGTGADQLLGNGDMLYQPSGQPKPVRVQNAFLSTAEVERVVEFIADQRGYLRPYQLPSLKTSRKGQSREDSLENDELMLEAAHLIVRHQQGSVSLLQRRLKIGYSRAARIVDQLEIAGVVGPADGSKSREVLVENEDDIDMLLMDYR